MQGYDAIISPTVPIPPVGLDLMSPFTPSGVTERRLALSFTQIANISGNPAMSVPLHWNREGTPIGIQFIGHYGDEATLFACPPGGGSIAARPRPLDRIPFAATMHIRSHISTSFSDCARA